MKTLNILTASFLGLMSISSYAATIESGEYQWNTDDDTTKWATHGPSNGTEVDDESGGAKYDIAFLGINVSGGEFKFGAQGGSILNGDQAAVSNGHGLFLSDFAIGVNTSSDPTTDITSEFGFAIRLLGVNDADGTAQFQLLGGGTWEAVNIYNDAYGTKHKSVTYKMIDGTELDTFEGEWTAGTGLNNVLEGAFDLSLLGYVAGDTLSTYLTMTCVNDEAFVQSAVPVPAALFMFAPALAGFMGLRRRMKATA